MDLKRRKKEFQGHKNKLHAFETRKWKHEWVEERSWMHLV